MQVCRHGVSAALPSWGFQSKRDVFVRLWQQIKQKNLGSAFSSATPRILARGKFLSRITLCTQEEKTCHSVEIDCGGLADRIDVWKPRGLVPASEHHSSSSITYFNKAFNFWFEHLTHPCWISVSSHSVFSDCTANKSSRWNRIQLTSAVPRHQPSLP